MKKLSLTALAVLSLSATTVVAPAYAGPEGGKGPGGKFFDMLDANKDGQISVSEMESQEVSRFDEMDANQDGLLSMEEMKQFFEAKKAEREANRPPRPELTDEQKAELEKKFEGKKRPPRPELTEEQKAEMKAKMEARMAKMFSKVDTDGDGQLSREEFATKASERFAKLDANDDGVVTKEEFKAAAKRHHGGHKGPKGNKGSKGFDHGVEESPEE